MKDGVVPAETMIETVRILSLEIKVPTGWARCEHDSGPFFTAWLRKYRKAI